MSSKWAAMVFVALPMMPAYGDVTAEPQAADARVRLSVGDAECQNSGREIVVCAPYNENDRYRLPFEVAEPGDPDNEGVWGERYRIQADPGTCQSWALFRSMCGGVGVSVGIGHSGPSVGGGLRTAQ